MRKFSVKLQKINLENLILIDEIDLISPYQQSKNNELIIGKSKKTSGVFSKTVFKSDNGETKTLKEKRDPIIFDMYNDNESCGRLNRKLFKSKEENYFIVIYNKEEMNDLTICFVKEENIDFVKNEEWIGVELTNMENIFSELSLIKIDFESIPRMLNEENISNILDFFNIKVKNISNLKHIMDKAEREREKKYGEIYSSKIMTEKEFISIFGEKSGLPFFVYQALECFFNEDMIDFSKNNGLGEYYYNLIEKLGKAEKIINFNKKMLN